MSFGWLPIDAAPKDGTPVLLFVGKVESYDVAGFVPWASIDTVIGWWEGSAWLGCFGDYHDSGCPTCGGWFEYPLVHPTHWLPLPAPPQNAA